MAFHSAKLGRRGTSMLNLAVSLGIAAITIPALLSLSRNFSEADQKLARRMDYLELKKSILSSIDCRSTLSDAGIDVSNPASIVSLCTSSSSVSSQSGPYFRIRMCDGKKVNGGTCGTSRTLYYGSDLDGQGRIEVGDFYLKVSCSRSEMGLVVRATRKAENNFDSEDALLFGESPGTLPLCMLLPS